MPPSWPKNLRRLAREGIEVEAVILGFKDVLTHEGGTSRVPVVRWIGPDGVTRSSSESLSAITPDPRLRGDVLRLLVDLDRPELDFVLAEPGEEAAEVRRRMAKANVLRELRGLLPRKADPDRQVVATEVASLEPAPGGGTRIRVRGAGIDALVGPVVRAPDPRVPGDPVDLVLDRSGRIVREPAGPVVEPGLREAMAREPSLLRKVWDSPFSPF